MVLTPGFFPRRKKVLGTATSRDGQHFTLDPSEPSGNSSVQGQTPDFSPGQGSGRQPMRYMVRPPSSDRPPGFRPTAAGDRPRDHWRLERVEQKVLESGLLALQQLGSTCVQGESRLSQGTSFCLVKLGQSPFAELFLCRVGSGWGRLGPIATSTVGLWRGGSSDNSAQDSTHECHLPKTGCSSKQ